MVGEKRGPGAPSDRRRWLFAKPLYAGLIGLDGLEITFLEPGRIEQKA
jgi:hypothetical protein